MSSKIPANARNTRILLMPIEDLLQGTAATSGAEKKAQTTLERGNLYYTVQLLFRSGESLRRQLSGFGPGSHNLVIDALKRHDLHLNLLGEVASELPEGEFKTSLLALKETANYQGKVLPTDDELAQFRKKLAEDISANSFFSAGLPDVKLSLTIPEATQLKAGVVSDRFIEAAVQNGLFKRVAAENAAALLADFQKAMENGVSPADWAKTQGLDLSKS